MDRVFVVSLNEMATIGYFGFKANSREFKVFVASESNLRPSFHISTGKKNTKEYKCIAVLLKTFMVIEFPDTPMENRIKFPKKVFKMFREFLDEIHIIHKVSNWTYILKQWNSEQLGSPDVWVEEDMPIPEVDDFQYAPKFGL